jgi:hypothetical protein
MCAIGWYTSPQARLDVLNRYAQAFSPDHPELLKAEAEICALVKKMQTTTISPPHGSNAVSS